MIVMNLINLYSLDLGSAMNMWILDISNLEKVNYISISNFLNS